MPKLLSETKWPPGGFQVLIPEAGMTEPFCGGFDETWMWLLRFVGKNPVLAQRLGLPTNPEGCKRWVHTYNARRCIAHGWLGFVDLESASPDQVVTAQKKRSLAAAVGNVGRKASAGVSAYMEMFGSVGPVAKPLAEARASVCFGCPQNDAAHGILDYLAEGIARKTMSVLAALKDLDLVTSLNDKLGICRACSCPLKAKVFAPLSVIVEKMPPEVWPELPRVNPRCWIIAESNRP